MINIAYGGCAPFQSLTGASVWKLADDILSANEANKVIYQSDVPYTTPGPGTYAIGQNLVSTSTIPIITNNFPDVVIDLKNHTLLAGGSNATAISLGANSNTAIRNGWILNFAPGITINGAQGLSIENITFSLSSVLSILATNASNIEIYDSTICGINFNNVESVIMRDCDIYSIAFTSTILIANSSYVTIEDFVSYSGTYIFMNVTDSIMDHGTYYGRPGSVMTSFTNCSHNIMSNIIRKDAAQLAIIAGTSLGNTFDNNIMQNLSTPGISIGAGAVGTRILSCLLQSISTSTTGIFNNGTDTEVYNTMFRTVPAGAVGGTPLVGGLVITGTNVSTNNANYWQDLYV
jgi:hypothetical protein